MKEANLKRLQVHDSMVVDSCHFTWYFQLLAPKLSEGQLCTRRQTVLEKVCASHLALHFFKFQAPAGETILVPEVNADRGQVLLPP